MWRVLIPTGLAHAIRPRVPLRLCGLAACAISFGYSSTVNAAALLSPRLVGAESFAESFTIIADLDDGGYLQLQLAVSNLGAGDGKGACRVLWVPFGQKARTASTIVDREDWRHQPGPPERLQMGRCSLTGGGSLAAHVEVEDLIIDLNLAETPRSTRPPDWSIRTDAGFYESEILIPWADGSGELREGEKKRALRGRGFSDHSRSTLLPNDIARQWVRFRGVADERPVLLLARFPPGGPVQAWIWRHGQSAPQTVETVTLSRVGTSGTAWESRTEGAGEALRFYSRQLLFRYAPVEQHGFLGRLARPLVGNPVTMTFRGVAQGLTGQLSVKGILEVTLNQGD